MLDSCLVAEFYVKARKHNGQGRPEALFAMLLAVAQLCQETETPLHEAVALLEHCTRFTQPSNNKREQIAVFDIDEIKHYIDEPTARRYRIPRDKWKQP